MACGLVLVKVMSRLRSAGLAGAMAGLLALAVALPLDTLVHDLAFRYVVSHEVRLLANGYTQLGTAWAAAGLLGALAIVAHRTADAGLYRVSLGGLAGVAVGSLALQAVKHVACRARPHLVDGWGVDEAEPRVAVPASSGTLGFFHWPCLRDSRYQGFPSGHATVAFAVAAALCQAVPPRRPLWLAVAGGVGVSRILLNAHFLSDVIGGGLLGWCGGRVGLWLVDHYLPFAARPAGIPARGEPGRGTPSA